jgi:hypothetical protein
MSPKTKSVIFMALIQLMGLGFLYGSGSLIYRQKTGEKTTATVTDCVTRRKSGDVCTGTWMAADGFHRGTIEGANHRDLDQRIPVAAWGDRAVTPSLRLPIILAVVGLGFVGLGWYWWLKERPKSVV